MERVYYKEWRARQGTVKIGFNDIHRVRIEHTSLSRIALPFVNSRGRAPRFLPLPLPPVGLRRAEATAASAALVTSLTLSPLPVYGLSVDPSVKTLVRGVCGEGALIVREIAFAGVTGADVRRWR